MNLNPDCCGSHCFQASGEVRYLTITKATGGSSLTLCRPCFEHEMRWRKRRNKELSNDNQFEFPSWDSLEVYRSE